MTKRNPHFDQLKPHYLFPEIQQRKQAFLQKNPQAELISLGIGDTTHPLPQCIVQALTQEIERFSTYEGYKGYGPEQGIEELRIAIAKVLYPHLLSPSEIYISDGAKCDIGRLQQLFGNQVSIAVQDPCYPVYIEGSLIQGVKKIIYMNCHPDNAFFPDLFSLERADLIYFCSPNNPTGVAATKEQLQALVTYARENKSIVIFDAAYSGYIQDPNLPKSIYEIEGAKEVAIEINSFSKLAGFTGLRLGWTVIPNTLRYEDGTLINRDWKRVITTLFNGASILSQMAGLAALSPQGFEEISSINRNYLKNAALLKRPFEALGYQVFGGIHAPYLWVATALQNSWDAFEHFLEHYHLLITPGTGFGLQGEGFIRVSAFAPDHKIQEAISRLQKGSLLFSH